MDAEWPWFNIPFSASWSSFGWYVNDVGTLVLDGTQAGDGAVGLEHLDSVLVVTGTVMGAQYKIDYSEHSLDGFQGLVSGTQPWQITGAAFMDLGSTAFDFGIEGGGAYADGCGTEPASGAMTASSSNDAVTFAFDGQTSCEACIPYFTDSGENGSVCGG